MTRQVSAAAAGVFRRGATKAAPRSWVTAFLAALALAFTARAAPNELAAPNADFGFELSRELGRKEQGNLFFSPHSLSTALAMTYAGAKGTTAEQLGRALHLPAADVPQRFAALGKELAAPNKAFLLAVANRLFAQRGASFRREFLEVTRTFYGASAEELDFRERAEPSRRHINTWVEKQTQSRIKDLLGPGTVTADTRLVLVNAIYFKGSWESSFPREATQEAPFRVGGKELVVPMMSQELVAPLGERDGVQVLELPYRGRELAMVVLLPKDEASLQRLEDELSAKRLDELLASLRPAKVRVFLPRFSVAAGFTLNEPLKALGVTEAFSCDEASPPDFSGMTGKKDVCLSAVVHKAFVEVNERGTEAAAASAVAVVGIESVEMPPPEFRADHPFVFLIRHPRSGAVLFLGRLRNPKP